MITIKRNFYNNTYSSEISHRNHNEKNVSISNVLIIINKRLLLMLKLSSKMNEHDHKCFS